MKKRIDSVAIAVNISAEGTECKHILCVDSDGRAWELRGASSGSPRWVALPELPDETKGEKR